MFTFKKPEEIKSAGHVYYITPDEMAEWLANGFDLGSLVKVGEQTLKVVSYCPFPTLGDKSQNWKFGTEKIS